MAEGEQSNIQTDQSSPLIDFLTDEGGLLRRGSRGRKVRDQGMVVIIKATFDQDDI